MKRKVYTVIIYSSHKGGLLKYIADLHVHSKYSRGTSRSIDLQKLWIWARLKGISVVATGDFTHPAWFSEIEDCLVENESGFYSLRPDLAGQAADLLPPSCLGETRFVLSTEISNIYKWNGKTRRIHNMVAMPDLESAASFVKSLARVGNLKSDGRPILGLDSRDLLELCLEASPDCLFFPAHLWTPHFSALGAFSQFETVDDCYRDLADHVFAVETGLSSDPPMNWRLSILDRFTLLSNSDAHSAEKLGREANIFDCGFSFPEMREAVKTRIGFEGTIEFFPEEGKYHLDGHRPCGVRLLPSETRLNNGRCPGCGKKVTIGVLSRVNSLADRPDCLTVHPSPPVNRQPYLSLIPLTEIISVSTGIGPTSKKVIGIFNQMISTLGPELDILSTLPTNLIAGAGFFAVAALISGIRAGLVEFEPGYDGEYGRATIQRGPITEISV